MNVFSAVMQMAPLAKKHDATKPTTAASRLRNVESSMTSTSESTRFYHTEIHMTSETREEIDRADADWDAAHAECCEIMVRLRTMDARDPKFRNDLNAWYAAQANRIDALERKYKAILNGMRNDGLIAGGAL